MRARHLTENVLDWEELFAWGLIEVCLVTVGADDSHVKSR